ncbi:cytochrome c biogenesis CcdA family protein [Candidatus Latescibacterota bacterium]
MIISLFTWLDSVLNSSPLIALIGSFIWGILSMILSPCHLSSIPLIIGFIDERRDISVKNAFFLSALFSLGLLITIAVIGLITGMLGKMIGDIGSYGNYFVAIIFFFIGLHLLGIVPMPFLRNTGQPSYHKKGMLAAFVLGLIFGIALGPCTFAFMAPMLGIVFKISAHNFIFALLLIVVYAVGHCSVIIIAGTFTGFVRRYLNWNERSKGAVILKKICGILVILGGVYMIYTAL